MRFRTTLLLAGKTATGIVIPTEVVEGLGGGKRPPVRVTINGFTYRSTIAPMGGQFMVGVNAENRAAAGVAAGDELDVDIELDDAPREVEVPADFAKALGKGAARTFFDGLAYSHRKEWVRWIEDAKKEETRRNRIDKAVTELAAGKKTH